jgi:hypothetical protein
MFVKGPYAWQQARTVYGVLGDSKWVKSFNIALSTVLIICVNSVFKSK